MPFRHFEDFHPGDTVELGSHTVTAAEIVAFATAWDPQTFHVDAKAAEESGFGGLVASGWHTSAIFMRLLVDGLLKKSSAIASPGVDELRWKKPVRPGDVLSARVTVFDAVPSRTRPDRGLVRHDGIVTNQRGETVMTVRTLAFFGRKPG
jgi:acyl dehydratase